MSPPFHSFLLIENFVHAGKDIFSYFPDAEDKVKEYFRVGVQMIEKYNKEGTPVDYIKLQDLHCPEVSNCLYVLIAIIYIEQEMNYSRAYPLIKALLTSNHLQSYPIKDVEYSNIWIQWNK